MNCANHPDIAAVAYCRGCGKALCGDCQRSAQGSVYCEEHVPAPPVPAGADASPYTSPYAAPSPTPVAANQTSPGLAFLLGMIPGVGAIYNGQYAKGLVHVIIVGLVISILDSGGASGGFEPLFGMLLGVFWFYMAFEAYHTAKRRQLGQPVDEFSSLMPRHGSGFPTAPVLLIALGVIFLLNNLDILRLHEMLKYWPVFLIVLGAYLLYARLTEGHDAGMTSREASHERR